MPRSRPTPGDVATLEPEAATDVVAVLADAFADYPVMRFVLGNAGDFATRLHTLVTFFVMARVLRGETMLGVRQEDGLVAAALISRPGSGASPAPLLRLRDETWAELGDAERTRYDVFATATAPLAIDAHHLHLHMIGVRRASRGRGLARRLLEAVHARSAADPRSAGVSLTTELETNVPLYRHFGYDVVGSADVASAFTTWGMFRVDG
jgi:GNAT superfamily N-acetyltransferase